MQLSIDAARVVDQSLAWHPVTVLSGTVCLWILPIAAQYGKIYSYVGFNDGRGV